MSRLYLKDLYFVKILRICCNVQAGARGITFHRLQFPVRLCYAVTINKSQWQTWRRVGLDLSGQVFCHGQLYVAWIRTTYRDNLLGLVKPERLIDGISCVHNIVCSEFIIAAAGHAPPVFAINL